MKREEWELCRKAMEYEYMTGYELALFHLRVALMEALVRRGPRIIGHRRGVGPQKTAAPSI